MSAGWVFALILVLVTLVFYSWYVALIRRRNQAQEALSSVDVQLRKRHDLVPNVLQLARRFMEHEKELLESVTALRNQAQAPYNKADADDVAKHLNAERGLQGAMRQLFAVSESYPELRSAETIQEAQKTYRDVESNIAAARRFYNAAVTRLNTATQIFPGSLIAGAVMIKPMPFFELDDEAARAPIAATDHL
jgi:LemA protein